MRQKHADVASGEPTDRDPLGLGKAKATHRAPSALMFRAFSTVCAVC
jgi:hypothetical protein